MGSGSPDFFIFLMIMKPLLSEIERLKKTEIKSVIDKRIKEFKSKKSDNDIFSELCFCILTANFNAEKSIKIQDNICNGFLTLPKEKLTKRLIELGHRFPNARSNFIVEARKVHLAKALNLKNEKETREFIVKNVKGLGYKESSHFLRNIGYDNLAIIDFHIVDLLVKHKIIARPKAMNKKTYLEIEAKLEDIAKKSNLKLSELDLYLWYMETGKVLK